MPKNRIPIEITDFKGLNDVSSTGIGINEFSSGKNFRITRDGHVARSKGTRKVFAGHGLDTLTDLYYHDDITDKILLFGILSGDYKTKVWANGSWDDIRRGVLVKTTIDDDTTDKTIIYLMDTKQFSVGDTVEVRDEDNEYSRTITEVNIDNIVVNTDVASLDITKTAYVANVSDDAYDGLHSGKLMHFISYLKTPVWSNGADVLYLSSYSKGTHTDAYIALSINEYNLKEWLEQGGDAAEYANIVGTDMAVQHNRLWLLGTGNNSNVAFYTRRFSMLFQDIGIGNAPFTQYIPVGGDQSGVGSTEDRTVAIVPVGNTSLILKGRSSHVVVGRSRIQFEAQQVNASIGCVAPYAVKLTKVGVFFFDGESIRLFNGNQFIRISGLRVENTLKNRAEAGARMVAEYVDDRYYVLSLSSSDGDDNAGTVLRFDIDTTTWSIEDEGYIGMTRSRNATYAIDNGGEELIQTEQGFRRLMEEDSSGGNQYAFEVQSGFIDTGSKSVENIWAEANVFVYTPEETIPMEVNIDGFKDVILNDSIDPRSRYGKTMFAGAGGSPSQDANYGNQALARYKVGEFDSIPLYTLQYLLPLEGRGYTLSYKLSKTSDFDIQIERVVFYVRRLNTFSQERE